METIMVDIAPMLKWLLGAGGITVVAQILRAAGVPQKIPAGARPLIGPALGVLASVILAATGIAVDFGPIEGALLGSSSAVLFDIGRGAGWLRGTGDNG